MILDMTKDQVKEILDRVLTWPLERQEDAAEILMSIEGQERLWAHRRTTGRAAAATRGKKSKNADTCRVRQPIAPLWRMKVIVREKVDQDLDAIFAWITPSQPACGFADAGFPSQWLRNAVSQALPAGS
jgi:hypothetical protein